MLCRALRPVEHSTTLHCIFKNNRNQGDIQGSLVFPRPLCGRRGMSVLVFYPLKREPGLQGAILSQTNTSDSRGIRIGGESGPRCWGGVRFEEKGQFKRWNKTGKRGHILRFNKRVNSGRVGLILTIRWGRGAWKWRSSLGHLPSMPGKRQRANEEESS